MIARKIIIEGQVQGVFFREWTVSKAREFGVEGWVRNLRNGNVEVYALGELATLDRFTAQMRLGSPASQVDSIEVESAAVVAVSGFNRRQTG